MNTSFLRTLIAVFLIAHGLVHFSLTYVPVPKPGELRTPFWPAWWRTDTDPAWLASKLGLSIGLVRGIGSALWVLIVIGFAVAGLGLLGVPALSQLWIPAAILGAAASIALHLFYWHPWLVLGVVIDLVVFVGISLHWPKFLFE